MLEILRQISTNCMDGATSGFAPLSRPPSHTSSNKLQRPLTFLHATLNIRVNNSGL
jgi:hypothetical protein